MLARLYNVQLHCNKAVLMREFFDGRIIQLGRFLVCEIFVLDFIHVSTVLKCFFGRKVKLIPLLDLSKNEAC